jgi:hypothetical protein
LAATNSEEGRMEGSGKHVVLLCEGCEERILLGGPLSVWNCGRTSFDCGCGARLTLSQRFDPPVLKERVEDRTALYR